MDFSGTETWQTSIKPYFPIGNLQINTVKALFTETPVTEIMFNQNKVSEKNYFSINLNHLHYFGC